MKYLIIPFFKSYGICSSQLITKGGTQSTLLFKIRPVHDNFETFNKIYRQTFERSLKFYISLIKLPHIIISRDPQKVRVTLPYFSNSINFNHTQNSNKINQTSRYCQDTPVGSPAANPRTTHAISFWNDGLLQHITFTLEMIYPFQIEVLYIRMCSIWARGEARW